MVRHTIQGDGFHRGPMEVIRDYYDADPAMKKQRKEIFPQLDSWIDQHENVSAVLNVLEKMEERSSEIKKHLHY